MGKYIIELEDKPFHKKDGDFLYRVKGFNSLVFDMTGICKLTPYNAPDLEQVRADAYLKGLNDGQGVILESTQNNAFNNGYKKCLEDMEQVRIEAFQEGKKQAKVQAELDVCHDIEKVAKENYKAGLSDAWDAVRKIIHMPEGDLLNIFTECYSAVCTALQVILKYDAPEAIEKIRQYEQEKEEKQHTWICSEAGEPSTDITLICSKCGYTITIKPGDTQALNFCPKCGDNKRGERDE